MAARVHFGAACSLLFEDWLAYGADNHLRSLLEIVAHVAWIQCRGCKAPPTNARSRALCYELAMVNALIEEVKLLAEVDQKVRPDVSGPSAIEAARAPTSSHSIRLTPAFAEVRDTASGRSNGGSEGSG